WYFAADAWFHPFTDGPIPTAGSLQNELVHALVNRDICGIVMSYALPSSMAAVRIPGTFGSLHSAARFCSVKFFPKHEPLYDAKSLEAAFGMILRKHRSSIQSSIPNDAAIKH